MHFSWCPFGAKKVAREEYVSTSKKVRARRALQIEDLYKLFIIKTNLFQVCLKEIMVWAENFTDGNRLYFTFNTSKFTFVIKLNFFQKKI